MLKPFLFLSDEVNEWFTNTSSALQAIHKLHAGKPVTGEAIEGAALAVLCMAVLTFDISDESLKAEVNKWISTVRRMTKGDQ